MLEPTPQATRDKGRSDAILDAVAKVLTEQKRAATEMQAVVNQTGLPPAEVAAEFGGLGELLVALMARTADFICRPLASEEEKDLRDRLIEFSSGLHAAYSSVMIGILRVAMTEGSRHREMRKRAYDKGPGAIKDALAKFLERAKAEGKIHAEDCALAAEFLIGMLREPLYQELTLHSQEFTFYVSAKEAVQAAVDTFLNGCNDTEEQRQ